MKNGMYPLCSYCIWFKKETQQEARVILPDRYTDKEKSYCCTWQISQAEIRRQDELRLERSPVMDVRFERADVFDPTCFVFPWFSRSWQALSVRHLSNAFHGLSTTISEIGNKSQVRYQNIFCSSEYIIHSCQSYLLKKSAMTRTVRSPECTLCTTCWQWIEFHTN